MAKLKTATILLFGLLFFCSSVVQAGVPGQISYQGKLTDAMQIPLDGTYSMQFDLFNVETDGTPLWSETQDVIVGGGVFNILLGAVNPLDSSAFATEEVYLETSIYNSDTGSWETLSPRQRLTSTAFAFKAGDADTLQGMTVGEILGSTGGNGLEVSGVDNGVKVVLAGDDGIEVYEAGDDGMYVRAAGGSGVSVSRAGSPSSILSSTAKNGFEVSGAEGHGLYVGKTDQNGVNISHASNDGVFVYRAGSPTTITPSSEKNGFEVAGAEGHGLWVGKAHQSGVSVYSAYKGVDVGSVSADGIYVSQAGQDGVEVVSASQIGLVVRNAGEYGCYVTSAGIDGLNVEFAGDDGLHVRRAGNPSANYSSSYKNGVEVAGAEDCGLYIGRADRYGVYVNSSGDWAGVFQGSVLVNGTLSKSSGSFKIDHPLDPENKYLHHSFVESPDMMNVYNGNVNLDSNGEAWVELAEWFDALNRDFRYQLTPIGGPMPELHISREIEDRRFQISGGKPGMKVSWQVTGIRRDPYAEAYRIQVEEEKPEDELGTYLHPEVYGMPETMRLGYKENQDHQNME
jgi:hypothetical protein